MSIKINTEKCTGCGRCENVCPGSLIKKNNNGKAFIKYPKDCWGCTSCIKECPVHAVKFYLGADIGGMGSLVYTEKHDNFLDWIIERPDGQTDKITINQKESNKY
jgi:adenylylsulfate reductase subunit B